MEKNLTCSVLGRFHVSGDCGFMLKDPKESLPEYFGPWEKLAKNCADLITTKQLRNEISKLEVIDASQLKGYREHRLAFMYLSFLTNGYIWQDGDKGVPKVLPKQLAVPLVYLSNYLGTKPAMGHTAFCLTNWKIVDKTRPAELGNLRTICQFPGGEEYDWFTLVTAAVELACAPALTAMVESISSVKESKKQEVISNLCKMTETLVTMKKTLSRMHENLSGDGFYNVFRPFLSGWGGPDSPLPDGLIYEGISDTPEKVIGGSAAQSSTISCFDAVLGIEHEKDKQEFLDTMLDYMPRDHREFVLYLRKTSTVKSYVSKVENNDVRKRYIDCVTALRDFRSYHVNLVTKYIVMQSRKENRNKDYEGVAQKGTAGTALIPFLQSLRNTTTP